MAYLSKKVIATAKTSSGNKLYTVQQLRSIVRQQIKEANKILIETEGGKKAPYLKQIVQDIAQYNLSSNKAGEYLTQSRVKYMTSSQLMSAYNALEGLKQADMSSLSYAKALAGKRDRQRRKWAKTIGENISKGAFDEMIELFEKYADEVNQYGYAELLDQVKDNRKHKRGKLIDDIKRVESEHPELGPKAVLKYIKNESALISLVESGQAKDIKEALEMVGGQ